MNEKWILTARELHLGHIKETFGAGSVIEVDEANNRLIIDGRKFDDARDLDILKRQAIKFPDSPYIVPFSEEALDEIRGRKSDRAPAPRKPRPGEGMQVVKSDEDIVAPIDITETQISKKSAEAKEAARNKPKSDKLEIIRGDETVEERLAALKDKTDINSMAERVRIKREMPPKMDIVHDDSLGAGVSKSASALNAGQSLPSRENADAKMAEARALADARKKESEVKRNALEETSAGVEVASGDPDIEKNEEIAKLKLRIIELEAGDAVRRPVKTVETAQRILGKK